MAMPNLAYVEGIENCIFDILRTSGLSLDAAQVAERASLMPSEAEEVLQLLADQGYVQKVPGRIRPRYSSAQ